MKRVFSLLALLAALPFGAQSTGLELQPVSLYALRLAERGRAPEAFAVVDAFQKRHPADPAVLYLVGRISASSGQELDRGEQALRKYLTVEPPPSRNVPSQSNAHFCLGNIMARNEADADEPGAGRQRLTGHSVRCRKPFRQRSYWPTSKTIRRLCISHPGRSRGDGQVAALPRSAISTGAPDGFLRSTQAYPEHDMIDAFPDAVAAARDPNPAPPALWQRVMGTLRCPGLRP